LAHGNIIDLTPRFHVELFGMIAREVRARFVPERGARGLKPEQYPNIAAILTAYLQSMCLELEWGDKEYESLVTWLFGKCYRGVPLMAGADATPEARDYALRIIEEGDEDELHRLRIIALRTDKSVSVGFSTCSAGLAGTLENSWGVRRDDLEWAVAFEALMLMFVARWVPDAAIAAGAKYSTNNVSTRDTRAAPDGAGRR